MTTKSGLANLECLTCGETTLHRGGVCIHCQSTNNQSGAPPVKRVAAPSHTVRATNYDARAEQASARRRAREARAKAQARVTA